MKRPVYHMRPNERLVAGSAYLAVLLPFWGILIAWGIRETWRERSRHVVFHTTQAIWLQVALLLAFVLYAMGMVTFNILDAIHVDFVEYLRILFRWIITFVAIGYAALCLAVAWLSLDGRNIILPLIGPRIYAQEFGEK